MPAHPAGTVFSTSATASPLSSLRTSTRVANAPAEAERRAGGAGRVAAAAGRAAGRRSPICGPTFVTSAQPCAAVAGGSTPAARAAIRSK